MCRRVPPAISCALTLWSSLGLALARAEDVAAQPPADPGKAAANHRATQPVVASGLGLTPQEALKTAFRNVVRQVVADLVDPDTRKKSAAAISEKVLSESDGLITAYKALDERIEDGIHQVRIAAEVSRQEVQAKLKAAGVRTRGSAGEGRFAAVLLDLEGQKSAVDTIRKAVSEYPVNVLKVEVAGKPRLVAKSDTEATFEYDLKFEVDPDKYSAFVKRLVPVLEKSALHKSGGNTTATEARPQDFLAAASLAEPRRFFPDHKQVQQFQWTGARFAGTWAAPVPADTDWGGKGFDPDTGMVLAVSTSHNPGHDKVNWRVYRVPRSRDYHLGLKVEVKFLDRDRKDVARDVLTLVPHHGLVITQKAGAVPALGGPAQKAYPFAVISPYFVAFNSTHWLYAVQVILPRRMTVSLDQLRRLDSVQWSLGSADLLRPEANAGR